MRRQLPIALGLLLLTAAVFAPVRHHEFVNYDDQVYIVENPYLQTGLSPESVWRALTRPRFYNWIPLTSISLQIDHALYGFEPAGYLLTNVALHGAATLALFLALMRMTAAPGRSAFVAAVFAVHPLHVESVAWATSRKDVLSGLFWMLTLLAYAGYARRRTYARYAGVAVGLVLALLAKPTAVTLPFVLLLLDGWPLGRLRNTREVRAALLEKLPLFALAAAAALVTYAVQQQWGGVTGSRALPLLPRAMNALDSYAIYGVKSVWPSGLAAFYPHPRDTLPLARVALAGAALLGVTLFVLRTARTRGYLAVGWFWYLGTLAPVIGLVQAGMQARADRYTYLPLVGLAIAMAWGATDFAARGRRTRLALAATALAAVAALAVAARVQVGYWRDTAALFERALAVTQGNFVAHSGLGALHRTAGRLDDAEGHYRAAVVLNPRWEPPHTGLGDVQIERGDPRGAVHHYRRALELDPRSARAHAQIARALAETGRTDEALLHLRRALDLDPDMGEDVVHANLGALHLRLGQTDEALRHYEAAAALGADDSELHAALAELATRRNDQAAAITHYRAALARRPGWREQANNLAWLLATTPDPELRDPDEAVHLASLALDNGGPDAAIFDTLAAAHAASGHFDAAVRDAEEALRLARALGASPLAQGIEERLGLYRIGRPYVEP